MLLCGELTRLELKIGDLCGDLWFMVQGLVDPVWRALTYR